MLIDVLSLITSYSFDCLLKKIFIVYLDINLFAFFLYVVMLGRT